jgi:RNA recognition motif-containing protein
VETKLYVGNLSEDVSTEALRKRFEDCGVVSSVQLATDRASGRMRGYAWVTMASEADARSAVTQLNGAMFEARPLRVNEAGEERSGSRAHTQPKQAAVRITSQFRERLNMSYELDCMDVQLSIKMFPEDPEEKSWRIEASTKNVVGAADTVITASAPTRAAALEELGRSWTDQAGALGLRPLDWAAVAEAMANVRAI